MVADWGSRYSSGPGKDGKPIRFCVLLDRTAPLNNHGVDADGQGNGTAKEYCLYQIDPPRAQG
jgi:hypothetical protein